MSYYRDRIRLISLKVLAKNGFEVEARRRMRDYILNDVFDLGEPNGETRKQTAQGEGPQPQQPGANRNELR